jgi:tripartite ATP-independent transporter DctP family solute receptor
MRHNMEEKPMKHALLAAALLSLGHVPAVAQDIQERIIRFGYGLNEDSVQGRAVAFFAEEVERLSGGKMEVRGFGGAALGSDVQMQAALAGGAQEMMVGSTATLVGTVKEFGVWDLPFLFATSEEADALLDGPVGQRLIGMLGDHGLVGLVYWENGFRNLTNSRGPIGTAEDMAGLKLRVMQNPVYLEVFTALGTNAVPMPFSELFTALETGAVDGQENPFTTILSSKFYEVQEHLTVTNHVYSPWLVMVSKSWWDGLSADEQKVLMEAALASRDFQRADNRAASSSALEELQANGMEVVVMPEDEIAKLRAAAQPIIDAAIEAFGRPLYHEVQAELAKLR